jgi:hypothetical protein
MLPLMVHALGTGEAFDGTDSDRCSSRHSHGGMNVALHTPRLAAFAAVSSLT